MTSRKHLALAAAALALGSFTFAQQADTGAGTGATGAAAQAQPAGQYPAQQAAGSAQSDQQALQQLQQIAQDPTTAADKLFILCAAHDSLICQQISQQVAQKAQSQDVKQLAQRFLQDEQQTQQRLQAAAQSLKLQLPRSVSPMEQQVIQIIAALPADQLDKQYVASAHAENTKNILKYQSCAQLSQNDAVKQFAQQSLPILQQEHQQAMAAAQAIGLPTGMEAITAGAKIATDGNSGRTDSPPAAEKPSNP